MKNLTDILRSNTYPGRGVAIGNSADGKNIVIIYFNMGRSKGNQSRIFVEQGEDVSISHSDPTMLRDASLVVYWPLRRRNDMIVVTNGDQTDTICEQIILGTPNPFEVGLRTRTFEPDPPHNTSRISGIVDLSSGNYKLNILKCLDGQANCGRYFYEYEARNGVGHFIHTYTGDSNPLQPFVGEPLEISIDNDIDETINSVWDSLYDQYKVSLLVEYIDLNTKKSTRRIRNKYSI